MANKQKGTDVNFIEARKKSKIKRVLGVMIIVLATIPTLISILKMLYFRINDGTALGDVIAKPIQKLVLIIYENTLFLEWFWKTCPTPNPSQLLNMDNIFFLIIYICIFVGIAMFTSGRKLAVLLRAINEDIEKQSIKESIQGEASRTRQEIENSTQIPYPSIFSQFHQLYLAPIITAIIGGIILKLSGF